MRALTCLALSFFTLVACGQGQAAAPAPPPAEAPATPPKAAEPVAAAEASDSVQDAAFALSLKPAGPYKKGELGNFVLKLEPRGKWHINQDYPTAIKVKGPAGLTLPKAELAKADAAEFGDNAAKFDVPFTAKDSGEHRVECEVDFAMCTEETCVPDTRTLARALPVE